ncbi:HPF/RaiA family ribosome-associated protein [Chitiniphilus purpureus]|uniref:HPF/RaiA family ribosome-associated protein n=1 Tax=Chitiniphilus purpureus TaxID=2981137 RepID=A0ABY6DN08_9NEIS|nr:HPF/RaiA family ribosome-associated protein [Chitiniphilus sp. CD1]UXY15053.1 HPF/RaiA family ribosome-associated protein [Chitiniphilus sp. CD1]
MQIQVRTDHHINGNERLAADVESTLREAFARFDGQLTRIDAHFSDDNGAKGGADDIRCTLEARLAGLAPQAAVHQAGDLGLALDGAIDKLRRQLESGLGKLESRTRPPRGGDLPE